MAKVDVLIVRAPGTNCELETAHAWEFVGARPSIVHIDQLIRRPDLLGGAQIVTIPGGFAHGDDISAGKIFALDLTLFLRDHLRAFVARGNLVLGICNGFQVLLKAGLLPGAPFDSEVTLAANTSGRYEDRWVYIAAEDVASPFVSPGLMYVPVAHAEGRVAAADDGTVARLKSAGRVAFRYVDEGGRCGDFPVNPNGSMGSIAGLLDETGRVLGLMPHPERNVHLCHHPSWTRLPRDRRPDGLRLFQNAVSSLQ